METQQRSIGVKRLPAGTAAPTLEQMYAVLANRRRRFAIHYLQHRGEPVLLGKLAERIAAWENGIDVAAVTSKQRKALYTALQQRHVPKLHDAGLVDFDRRQGLVTPTAVLEDVRIYAEVVAGREFPWSHYYLGLSALLSGIAAAVWAGAPVVTALPTVAWLVFSTVLVAVSSIAHAYVTTTTRLGVGTEPPELRHERAANERTEAEPTAAATGDDPDGPGETGADGDVAEERR